VTRGAPAVDNIVSVARLAEIVWGGAKPISWVSLACKLQRDWARVETVPMSSTS
jgi:hypothetical protein